MSSKLTDEYYDNIPFMKTTNLSINNTRFVLECPTSVLQKVRGLSGRLNLSTTNGMFFSCNTGRVQFTMKGMLFPLDFVAVDTNYKIIKIIEHVPTNKAVISFIDVFGVIEFPIGTVKKYRLKVGDEFRT